MQTWGPLEIMVLSFPGERLDAEALSSLAGLRGAGHVRVVDSLVVRKSSTGELSAMEIADVEGLDAFGGHDLMTLIDGADAEEVGEIMEPDTSALVVLVEHLWAKGTAEAVQAAGGELLASVRIPAQHAEEAARAVQVGG